MALGIGRRHDGTTPGATEARFPGFDVVAESGRWDEVTRGVVLARLGPPVPLRFFAPGREATVRALVDRLLAQDAEPRVPVVETIDRRLLERRGDGFRFADMPEDWDAWNGSVDGLDADARSATGRPFADLPVDEQRQLVEAVRCTGGDWHGMPAARVFSLWTRYCCDAFYSHPWAWNEIGFGGPAYPRGYKALGIGKREDWEVDERQARDPVPWAELIERAHTGHPRERRADPTAGATVNGVRQRNESAWLLPNDGTRTDHGLRDRMRRFDDDVEVDLVVVGCGAGGSVLTQRLARRGWKVVALDAGPFWDPDADWVSDEAGSHHLYWTEPRVVSGADPVPLGSNNSGRGVGGSMVHFAGYAPRLHPSDFATSTNDGVGADWPFRYEHLRPYYAELEGELPVAGQAWPWGDPHRYPQSPHPVGGNGEAFLRGCAAMGIEARVGPVAITNGRFGNRPHCIYRGFCLQGCKVNAKASPLITHVPDALAHGAEVRADSMVIRVELGADGRAVGVTYLHRGVERHQRARVVAVAGYSIETPRLLLNSASPRFPDGLCNQFDQVGRYLMVQGAPQTAGRYEDVVRQYKAPPPEASSEDFYETDPKKEYRRGFALQCVSPLPMVFAEHVTAQGHWGEPLRAYLRDFVHWATFGALCEFLPLAGNRVTLADEHDRHGLPIADFSYSLCDNDRALVEAATEVMSDMHLAAGADEAITIDRYAHLVGGCRMAASPRDGVVDGDLRTFAVPNLFITDGSVLPTQGSANPALTIMALAARAADHLGSANRG